MAILPQTLWSPLIATIKIVIFGSEPYGHLGVPTAGWMLYNS